MAANQLLIDGINRELIGTGWIAGRSRVNEESILIGHKLIDRCALITPPLKGTTDTLTFVTVHEESARTLSRTGFKESKTFETMSYEGFKFRYWNRLIRFLQELTKVDFDMNSESKDLWEYADYEHELV